MAVSRSNLSLLACFLLLSFSTIVETQNEDSGKVKEKEAAEKEKKYSAIHTAFLLVMMFLLIITVLTVWIFKVKRWRFLHETGFCMIYCEFPIIGTVVSRLEGAQFFQENSVLLLREKAELFGLRCSEDCIKFNP